MAASERQIHDDQVRIGLIEQSQRFVDVGSLTADLEIRLRADPRDQAVAHQRMIVDYQDPRHTVTAFS